MYLGGFHRPNCAATAAELGPRAMHPGGFHRPHCAATAAKPGPRAMYLLRQRLGPRAMYLGGFHRPHCATTAAELGPRAMYLGGFHRPHCVAAAANASPCHRQSRDFCRPCCTAARSPRRFSPPPLRRSGGKRQPLPRPISRLVSPMLHCSPRLRPPRVSTPPTALGASKTTVALTPSKASYTANLSLPCPLSLCAPSPSQVYHVYTEDPHVYTKVRPLMPNLPLSSLLSPAYSGSPVLLPFFLPPQDRYVYG